MRDTKKGNDSWGAEYHDSAEMIEYGRPVSDGERRCVASVDPHDVRLGWLTAMTGGILLLRDLDRL